MCSIVAPFLLPGLACTAPRATPGLGVRPTMAMTYAEGPQVAAWGEYGYYDDGNADIGALLRGIGAVVLPSNIADLPKPPMHGDRDAAFNAMLRGIPRVRAPAAGLMASVPRDPQTPTTPVAVLAAPHSYGDDAAAERDAITATKTPPPKKKQQQCDAAEYDVDIDATLRVMETDPAERPSPDYLIDTQLGAMMMSDRAELVDKMHRFARYYELAPGALHRAVSYVDRFLSTMKITDRGRDCDSQLLLLGAVAVFAAAKYEDRTTCWNIDADAVAAYAGCSRRDVLDAERELVAALRYHLSGPTAHTFVDHLMRHEEEGVAAVVRALAHHLADMALLDYRCVAFLPSAVAASAILLARVTVLGYHSTMPVAGYEVEELRECVEAIYDMHDNLEVWPGCARMMQDWELTTELQYSLPPLYMMAGMC